MVRPGAAANAIAGTYAQVASTQDLLCARNSKISCWNKGTAARGGGALTFSTVDANFQAACGVAGNSAYCWDAVAAAGSCCWGSNGYGMLGYGTTTYRDDPVLTP